MGSLRAAGFIICRKLTNQFEYLLMQASYEPYHWSPPKGTILLFPFTVIDSYL